MSYTGLSKYLITLFLFGSLWPAAAQTDRLQQTVDLDARAMPLHQVLDNLQRQINLSFAYNPRKLPMRQPVTYRAIQVPLNQVLDSLGHYYGFTYRLVEQQLVLLPTGKSRYITLSGYVYDRQTGEALIGALVTADSLHYGVVSNGYGFYALQLPPGSHRLQASYVGFAAHRQSIDLTKEQHLDIHLRPDTTQLAAVLVQGMAPGNIELVQTGRVALSPATIGERPVALGETDVIKALESVPGISLQSEGSTFFYVRGGNKDQNLILIDDAPVYNPTHLLGFYSSITPDAANAIDVYKSDFPLSKSGRLSSVIDIKIKEGNNRQVGGWGHLSPVSWQLGLEGPLKKEASSFMLTGRFSSIKWAFKQAFPDLDKFLFYDLTAKTNVRLNSKHRLFMSFYTGSDAFLTTSEGLSWRNLNGSLRWNYQIKGHVFMNTIVYGSNYAYRLYYNRQANQYWRSRIGELGLKTEISWFGAHNREIKAGLNITARTLNPGNLQTNEPVPPELVVSVRNNLETALYGQHQLNITSRLALKYGLRLSLFSSLGDAFEYTFNENGLAIDTTEYAPGQFYNHYWQGEPRLTLSYALEPAASLKFSYGRMVQNLHLISNTISPFSSFEVWLPSGPNIKPAQADQLSLGYYRVMPAYGLELQAEVFYKWMYNQLDYKDHAATLLNPTIEAELVTGLVNAYGAEVLLRKKQGRLRGQAAYTYARSQSRFAAIDGGRPFNNYADRPHHLNLEVAYDLGPRTTLSSHFMYLSGLPFSSPTAFYHFNGTEVPVYSQRNNDRLPPYHRLDLALKFILNKRLTSRFHHSITLSVYNVYSRKNPIFINFNKIATADGKFAVPVNLPGSNRLTTQTYLFRLTPAISYQFKF